jgi:hypothetical protein
VIFFPLQGMKKPEVKLLYGENCIILKKFSEGKAPIKGPYYRRKKKPGKEYNI